MMTRELHQQRTSASKIIPKGNREDINHWINQRISAISIIPIGLILLFWLLAHVHDPYEQIMASMSSPWVSTLFFLFIASVSYHAVLGAQVIIDDYVQKTSWRHGTMITVRIFGFLLPTLSLFFLIKIMLIGMR